MKRCDNPDVFFTSRDGYNFALHSPMLKLRCPLYVRSKSATISRLEALNRNEVVALLEYIYSGSPVLETMKPVLDSFEIRCGAGDTFLVYHNDMRNLLNSHDGADFIIECGGVKFPVHRFILAIRSEFFAGLFQSQLSESRCGVLKDDVAGSPDRMRFFLEFVYTGDAQFSSHNDLFHLLKLCNHYDIIEGFPGEHEEFVASKVLQLFNKKADEVIASAKTQGYKKLVDILQSC